MSFINSGVPNLQFSILGAELTCAFCTQTSVAIHVKSGLKNGWIDLHFPCEGHIKVRILAVLPDDLWEASKIRELVPKLLDHLKIQQDETYEATFFKSAKVIEMGRAVNRDGMTDRIEIERKHITPE